MVGREYSFSPAIGAWQLDLARMAREFSRAPESALDDIGHELDDLLRDTTAGTLAPSTDRLRYAFALSVLCDISAAGGRVRLVDSKIFVAWPQWESDDGRALAARALDSVAGHRTLTSVERRVLTPLFAWSVTPESLAACLSAGTFELESVDSIHPSGIRYGEAFSAALNLWRMPYRGREGRSRRLVVLARHTAIGDAPVVAGLIEIGDDAPFSSERDQLLGLTVDDALDYVNESVIGRSRALAIAERIQQLRSALLPAPGVDPSESAVSVLSRRVPLLQVAEGRSQYANDLEMKKRIAYFVRLAHGENAFRNMSLGAAVDPIDLREGVRAIHDLTVPRVHMEVTVCGAIPPFSYCLGGKLVVSFLSHRAILAATLSTTSSIVKGLFDLSTVQSVLPHWGVIALTTKGLYPGHSALYNRAEVVGAQSPLRLKKIGETKGSTTNLLSARTGKLAQLLMDGGDNRRAVSRTYGTGGAKRQRVIEAAVMSMNLPGSFVHAGIRRPIYGLPLVRNIRDVVWAGHEPQWLVPNPITDLEYSRRATQLWRDRWLTRATERLEGRQSLPGALELLTSEPRVA